MERDGMAKTLTLKTLVKETGAPFYTIKYLNQCGRLPILTVSKGPGYANIYHPDAIDIIKTHLAKRSVKDE